MSIRIEGCGLAGVFVGWQLWLRGIAFEHSGDTRGGASQVAAGLMNPVTGKGMNPSWRCEEFLPEARDFFQKVEELLGKVYFHRQEVLRVFATEKESRKFDARRAELSPWVHRVYPELPEIQGAFHGGVSWQGGGWVNVPEFLKDSLAFFRKHPPQVSQQAPFQPGSEIRIWCQGALGLREGLFSTLPTRLAKGEILEFEAPRWNESRILNRRGWLIPIGGHRFRVGATYEWDELSSNPTEDGLQWLLSLAREFTAEEIIPRNHVAGVRPIVRNSIPVVGQHEASRNDWVLNGLGSKGCLYGPSAARQLVAAILDGDGIDPTMTLASVPRRSGI